MELLRVGFIAAPNPIGAILQRFGAWHRFRRPPSIQWRQSALGSGKRVAPHGSGPWVFGPVDGSRPMSNFEGVHPTLSTALTERGYETLTPVQLAVIASDLGSGKTVAFGLALAEGLLGDAAKIEPSDKPLALIIAPTRELAMQVKAELMWLYAGTGARFASCVGGMDSRSERKMLQFGAHIVVGTPGRLRDHIEKGALDLSALRCAVLDEADEMLDLGFREDLEFILDSAPNSRRTLMFSATVSKPIAALAKSYQRDAVRISTVSDSKQHLDIDYRAISVAKGDKEHAIINLLRFYDAINALVFCGTRATVNHLMARFNNRGFRVVALSGELSQAERTHALQAMRDGRANVCIATDVAARGIDLPNLELVIHADLPTNRETLLHRSGRTGRAGRKGVSAVIVQGHEKRKAERIFQAASVTPTWEGAPSADDIIKRDDERLISHPLLSEPLREDDAEMIAALLAKHGAETVAAAFVRLNRDAKSAPEDVTVVAPGATAAPTPRDEFKDSVWIVASTGRNQNAEARSLLPIICKAGDITRREVGAIRLQDDESFIQLDARIADKFMANVGPDHMIAAGIRVARLPGQPEFTPRGRGTSEAPKAKYRAEKPHKPGGGKPWAKDAGKSHRKGPAPEGAAKPFKRKPKPNRD